MKKQIKFISTILTVLALFTVSACSFGNSSDDEKTLTTEEKITNFFSNSNIKANWSAYGNVTIGTDDVYKNWKNPYLASDTHGDILKLSFVENFIDKSFFGSDAYFTLSNLKVNSDSYLVFDYKTSFQADTAYDSNNAHNSKPYYSETLAKIYVDDILAGNIGYNGNTIWRTKGLKLSSNTEHTIKWLVTNPNRCFPSFENSLYLDNIKLVPASEFETIDISPKGQQDVVVNKPLKFTASANWTDTKPTITASNGASIDSNGNFIATTPGNYSVQASLDGKTSMTIFVTVHAENYLETEKSFTLPGSLSNGTTVTFTGNITNEGTNNIPQNITFYDQNNNAVLTSPLSSIITFDSPTPTKTSFSADGFFVIKGTVNYPLIQNYDSLYLYVWYNSNHGTHFYTSYPLGEHFNQRIWLPFDATDDSTIEVKGQYIIFLALGKNNTTLNAEEEEVTTVDLTKSDRIFTVKNSNINARNISYQFYPSSFINYDNFEVTNAVHDALYGNNDKSVTIKLQLIHDWIIHHFHYDYVSLKINNRKPQDAVSCITNNMAVCEGYASVFAAMARYCVIPTEFYASIELNHSWNIVYLPNQNYVEKLVDATWDDTAYDKDKSNSNIEKYPYSECYNYFLIDPSGVNNDHYYPNHPEKRSISDIRDLTPSQINGIPEGWY